MANFLLLPSFHFKIRLAAFQLIAETVVVVASAAAGVVARKRVANNLLLRAALVSNLVSALSSEDSCGGWRTAAAGVEWLHLCLAGWHRRQTPASFSARFPPFTLPMLEPFPGPWECRFSPLGQSQGTGRVHP